MGQISTIRVKVDAALKDEAAAALSIMGLSMSDAVRLLLTHIVQDRDLPIALKTPNAETQAAILEARSITKPRFSDAASVFDALEKNA